MFETTNQMINIVVFLIDIGFNSLLEFQMSHSNLLVRDILGM
jgi:hypothetical protein